MFDSLQPHRRQPTRLPRPWDSPGKNTGVGCNFLLQCVKVKSKSEVAQWCPTLSDPMDCSPPGSSAHGIFQARVLEWGAIAFSLQVFANVSPSAWNAILSFVPSGASPKAQQVKNLPAVQGTQEMQVWSLGLEDPLEEEMALHSSILACEVPWTAEPGGLQSLGLQRVGHDWLTEHAHLSLLCLPTASASVPVHVKNCCSAFRTSLSY